MIETHMKTQTLTHVSAAEFKRTLQALVAKEGSQKAAADRIGCSQASIMQALLNGRVGRKIPAYFGLKVVRALVPADKTQGK